VLKVSAPVGNIFLDEWSDSSKVGNFERLKISRMEMEKRILRRRTDRGTDVGLRLDSGTRLRNGDILAVGDDHQIVVEQLPERVITVRIKTGSSKETMILLGHIIGNRHRPIAIQEDTVIFPIYANSEKKVFADLFYDIIDHLELTVEDRVFSPHSGADVHGH